MPESSDSSVAATDKDRVLQLKSPFGADVVATHVSGAERLSQLFHFDLSHPGHLHPDSDMAGDSLQNL